MKKLIVLFSAVAALAACSKNEVVPAVSGENVEISYKVAPRTKADATQAFGTENVFASWAYYLPSGKSWGDNWEVRKDAKPYIGEEHVGSTISYKGGVWKDQTTSYYWPKGGKLTFFAYSLNSKTLPDQNYTDTFFYCENDENAYGITGSLNLDRHPNTDFLVADIATDKTTNESKYNFTGVPTLFKHRLSRIKFAVKKKADYTNATITLNSITFNKLINAMTYTQFNKSGDGFSEYMNTDRASRSIQEYTKTDFEVASTEFVSIPDNNEVRYIYIPQDFKNVTDESKIATIEVKYTVKFKNGISETCTKTLNVKEIFNSWEMGKRYTFNLIFSLDEINWAPAVGDWEDGNNSKDVEIKDPEKVEKVGDTTIKANDDRETNEAN